MSCLVLTLQEMLKLALGSTPLEEVHVAILHSFLKIVIEKLKIQTDFVEISGPEVKVIREMLCKAHYPSVDFTVCSDEKIIGEINVFKMQEEINTLTKTINRMQLELDEHLDAVERCKRPLPVSRLQLKKSSLQSLPEEDQSDCEDLTPPCDEKNLIACDLLQNKAFLKKLMRLIASPIVDRIFEFENMITILNEKYQNFLNTADSEYRKIPLVEECLIEIKSLKKQLDKHQEEFIDTMEEVQDMMDAKFDKIHVPALKKYISDKIDELEIKLDAVIQKEQCPKAAGVIMTNLQCLCCTSKVCQKDKVFPVPILAGVNRFDVKPTKFDPNFCFPQDQPRASGGEHTVIRPTERTLHSLNLTDHFGDQMNLPQNPPRNAKYFKGLRRRLYRQTPQD